MWVQTCFEQCYLAYSLSAPAVYIPGAPVARMHEGSVLLAMELQSCAPGVVGARQQAVALPFVCLSCCSLEPLLFAAGSRELYLCRRSSLGSFLCRFLGLRAVGGRPLGELGCCQCLQDNCPVQNVCCRFQGWSLEADKPMSSWAMPYLLVMQAAAVAAELIACPDRMSVARWPRAASSAGVGCYNLIPLCWEVHGGHSNRCIVTTWLSTYMQPNHMLSIAHAGGLAW